MSRIDYVLLDVFTAVPFTGNQLAVVLDAPELTDGQRQRVARELQLSETVFLTASDHGWTTRIFTPEVELPFAGHPTIGAALALVDAGRASDRVVLHEGVGEVVVTVADGWATLTTPVPPSPVECADPDDVAGALELTLADLHPSLGPRAWTAGVPFTMVAVRDVATLGRATIDVARWREGVALTAADALYVLAPSGPSGEAVEARSGSERSATWRARMLGPGLGIAEDPATGSAAAAAVGYLAAHAREDVLVSGWTIFQGVEMGRPSELRIGAVRAGADVVASTVSGQAVVVGAGSLDIPPSEGPRA